MERTLGEKRVGVDINPSCDARIDHLKRLAAKMIDRINELPAGDGETARLKAVAMTEVEGAAMWTVKAAARSAADQANEEAA